MNNNKSLTYDDISLVAKYYDGDSRSNISTNIVFGNYTFKLPVIPANMKCVIDFDRAEWLAKNKYFYIMHRFCSLSETLDWIQKMNNQNLFVSISVGVNGKDKEFLNTICNLGLKVDYLTIDIAHGHCRKMKEILKFINETFSNDVFIIAGNVMTKAAVLDLKNWGANCAKVGLGPGKSCLTKFKTGFHSPMFSTVKNCCDIIPESEDEKRNLINKWREEYARNHPLILKTEHEFIQDKADSLENFPIIADGGVRHNGDIFKALVAGAKMVMVGSLFSGCIDSPAEDVYNKDGVLIGKQYYGSASEYNKGHKRNIEGTLIQLKCNGMTYEEKLEEILQDLQSSVSYSGHSDISSIKEVEYIVH